MDRNFKGIWMPRELWLDDRLTAIEKFIFAEIDSLDDGENGCFASNEYLAEFCRCSERKVTAAIKKLVETGYIKIESFNGRKRVIRVAKNARQSRKKCEAESQKMRGSYSSRKIVNNIVDNSYSRSYDLEKAREKSLKKPEYKKKK